MGSGESVHVVDLTVGRASSMIGFPVPACDACLRIAGVRSGRNARVCSLAATLDEKQCRHQRPQRTTSLKARQMVRGTHREALKQFYKKTFLAWEERGERRRERARCIFLLTFFSNNLIYESRCDLLRIANSDVRENQSMKNATKKAAKKAPAKKAAAKKKK